MRLCLLECSMFRQRVPQIKSNVYQMFTKKAKRRSNILFKKANLEVLLKERENSNIKH
jgi:hypothetical protein